MIYAFNVTLSTTVILSLLSISIHLYAPFLYLINCAVGCNAHLD